MNSERNVQVVKEFFGAVGRGDTASVSRLTAEDTERVIPGKDWPLAGVHRGRAALEELLRKARAAMRFSCPEPLEFVAQGDRVLAIGFAEGRVPPPTRPSRTILSSP